jgi:hypothetical protein
MGLAVKLSGTWYRKRCLGMGKAGWFEANRLPTGERYADGEKYLYMGRDIP